MWLRTTVWSFLLAGVSLAGKDANHRLTLVFAHPTHGTHAGANELLHLQV